MKNWEGRGELCTNEAQTTDTSFTSESQMGETGDMQPNIWLLPTVDRLWSVSSRVNDSKLAGMSRNGLNGLQGAAKLVSFVLLPASSCETIERGLSGCRIIK